MRPPLEVCQSKVAYFSANTAAKVADAAEGRERQTHGGYIRMRVYKCPLSEQGRPHYHLTCMEKETFEKVSQRS